MRNAVRLNSKTARADPKLKPRGVPYWRDRVGYRKLNGKAGTWWVRHYLGNQKYEVEALGIADDFAAADGVTILTYAQALKLAGDRIAGRTQNEKGTTAESILLRQAVESYIVQRDERETRRRGREVHSDASRLRRYVLGQEARGKQPAIEPAPLAAVPLHRLADADLKRWRKAMPADLKDSSRKRTINDLKAALNACYRDHKDALPPTLPATIQHGLRIEEDDEDDAESVARDNQILTDAQVGRIITAARIVDEEQRWGGDLYRLVLVLASTGARFGQVARMKVTDYQPEFGRVQVPFSRKGKKRKADHTPRPVAQDVLDALHPVTVGRSGGAPLLERWRHRQVVGKVGEWERAERGPWQTASELVRPWAAIRERAGMPHVIPYALRHSSIVRNIRAGLPLQLVANLHDTSTKMIERHYGKHAATGLEDMVRAAVVALVPRNDGAHVVPLRGR